MKQDLLGWLRPNVRRSTIALATGLGAGTLLLSTFTIASSVGLLPESRRPEAWQWFLCLSVSGLTAVAAIAKLENLQVAGRRGGGGFGGGWLRPEPNGSLYERTTTQLAVHLLQLEPGTQEFQAFTIAGADVMNHVGSVHGTVHELTVPRNVHTPDEPFIGGSSRPAQSDELATIAALNQLLEAPNHANARPTEFDFGGNSPWADPHSVEAPPQASNPATAAAPNATVRHNSFFGNIEL